MSCLEVGLGRGDKTPARSLWSTSSWQPRNCTYRRIVHFWHHCLQQTSGAKTSSPRKPVFSGLTSREQAGQTSQTSHGREMQVVVSFTFYAAIRWKCNHEATVTKTFSKFFQGLSLQAIDDRINTLKRSLARSSTWPRSSPVCQCLNVKFHQHKKGQSLGVYWREMSAPLGSDQQNCTE